MQVLLEKQQTVNLISSSANLMKSSLPISQRRNSRDLRYYGMENSSHKRRVFFGDLTLKKVFHIVFA
jgi:hypothetical protein